MSAFDPYFIDDPEPSTSNKLHQLLATVANEWNSSCDPPIATSPTAMMMSNCNTYQSDRYGSSQYEVVESVSLRYPTAWSCFLNKSLTISLINCCRFVLINFFELQNSINSQDSLVEHCVTFYNSFSSSF